MHRNQLLSVLNRLLSPHLLKDYCPNGLQIEGKSEVTKIVTGVTASQALIEKAVELNADAILVHHGYFWKNEAYNIVGIKKKRIARLLEHDINLFAYHLPIDIHATLGNNAQLGLRLGLQNIKALDYIEPSGIVMQGELLSSLSNDELREHISKVLERDALSVGCKANIKKVAWCTGGGQSYIDALSENTDIDAFISGEISEQTTHSARELGIDYFAAGHHATERYGVKAVGDYLERECALVHEFVDIDNPA